MANRNFNRAQALNKEVKIIAGRFDDAGSKVTGFGYSVTKGATGIYTVNLEDAYPYLLAATATVEDTGDYAVTIASHDVSKASQTIVFHVTLAGSLADLSTGGEIHFSAFLQNSGVPVK
jgi:hypothetical protein